MLLFVLALLSAPPQRFAVLELTGSKDWTVDELMLLSDGARGGVLGALPAEAYLVITRESMVTILREMGKNECVEGECEVDTLRHVGADFGITGKVVLVDGVQVLTLKLFESRTGRLIAQQEVEAKGKRDLMKAARTAATVMCQRMLELERPTPASPRLATERGARNVQSCRGGDARACFEVGQALQNGDGVAEDAALAGTFYQHACQLRSPDGCRHAAIVFLEGIGRAQSDQQAVSWFTRGCELEDSGSCTGLGTLHLLGRGVEKSEFRAVDFYALGCNGNPAACRQIGIAYDSGRGAPQNEEAAYHHFQLACDGRDALGCRHLANALENGAGVKRNSVLAARYRLAACEFGDRASCR